MSTIKVETGKAVIAIERNDKTYTIINRGTQGPPGVSALALLDQEIEYDTDGNVVSWTVDDFVVRDK